jgi:hypothetical protein
MTPVHEISLSWSENAVAERANKLVCSIQGGTPTPEAESSTTEPRLVSGGHCGEATLDLRQRCAVEDSPPTSITSQFCDLADDSDHH